MEHYETTKKLDLRHVICPATFSMTREALSNIQSGDVIQVRLNSREHMENVPNAVLHDGHQVLDIIKDGSSYVLYIMKQ